MDVSWDVPYGKNRYCGTLRELLMRHNFKIENTSSRFLTKRGVWRYLSGCFDVYVNLQESG